jgi:hypothetical protein
MDIIRRAESFLKDFSNAIILSGPRIWQGPVPVPKLPDLCC